jgi:hypothetical protein
LPAVPTREPDEQDSRGGRHQQPAGSSRAHARWSARQSAVFGAPQRLASPNDVARGSRLERRLDCSSARRWANTRIAWGPGTTRSNRTENRCRRTEAPQFRSGSEACPQVPLQGSRICCEKRHRRHSWNRPNAICSTGSGTGTRSPQTIGQTAEPI